MKRVPLAGGVRRALRAVQAASKKALKALNQVAAQRMAKGDYATAETLAGKGRDVRQFLLEVDALNKRWRDVSGAQSAKMKSACTPLWGYYQPILQALDKAGGECRRVELEAHVECVMSAMLQSGDRETTSRGKERWRIMVQRARRPLAAEGWIENGGKVWRITEAGRRTAEKPMRSDPSLRP